MTISWLTLGLTSRWSVKLDHKLIESTKDGDLMLALDADAGLRKMLQTKTNKKQQRTSWKSHTWSHMVVFCLFFQLSCCVCLFPCGFVWAEVTRGFNNISRNNEINNAAASVRQTACFYSENRLTVRQDGKILARAESFLLHTSFQHRERHKHEPVTRSA